MLTKKVSQVIRRLLKIVAYSLLAGAPGLAFSHAAKTDIIAIGRDSHSPFADSLRAIGEAYLSSYPAGV